MYTGFSAQMHDILGFRCMHSLIAGSQLNFMRDRKLLKLNSAFSTNI